MKQDKMVDTMVKVGALITGSHIVYTSGRHGDSYVNKDAIYPHTAAVSELCESFANHFAPSKPDVVVAPAIGGVILSQWTAHHLSRILGKEVLSLYAEKLPEADGFTIRRGYDKLLPNKKVLIVEDVITTGGSVRKVVDIVAALKSQIVGIAALCNRGGLRAESFTGVPELYSLAQIDLSSWTEGECPLCQKNVPINTDVGKGREFLARKNA